MTTFNDEDIDCAVDVVFYLHAAVAEALRLSEKHGGTRQRTIEQLQRCLARACRRVSEPAAAEDKEPTYAERKLQVIQVMRRYGEKAYAVGLLRREFSEVVEAMPEHALRGYDEAKLRNALAKDMPAGPA